MTETTSSLLKLIGVAIGLWILFLLLPVIKPFFIAFILAYLGSGIVAKLKRWGLPRWLGTLIVFILTIIIILALGFLIIPTTIKQILFFADKLPHLAGWLEKSVLPWLHVHFGTPLTLNLAPIQAVLTQNLSHTADIAQWALKQVTASGFAFAGFLIDVAIVIVVAFYLMRDWPQVLQGTANIFPRRHHQDLLNIAKHSHRRLKGFILGQLLVMIALGIIYSVGLSIVGLDTGIMIGIVAGLLSIVPYFGSIIGLLLAILAGFIQFGWSIHMIWILVVFAIGHVLEGMVLTPLLVGDKIGMHPVAVIFAVLAGELLFGFTGILLALPVAAVLMVVIQYYRNGKQIIEN